jgi:hypothetical protein
MPSSRAPLVTVARITLRADFVVLLLLGIAFWTGHLASLVPLHMALGVLFVVALWTVAGSALAARVAPGLAGVAVLWGVLLAGVGASQTRLLVGDLHWVVRVCHLLIALIAMPIAERLSTAVLAKGGG